MAIHIKRILASITLALSVASQPGFGAATISGNVSGIWTEAGSPYILVGNTIVPSGQSLSMQPGTTVIIGPDVRLTVNGGILAVGTPERRIAFRGATVSNYWYSVLLNWSRFTNQFRHCQFSEARYNALSIGVVGGNHAMLADIENCSFSNCVNGAIWGYAQGVSPGASDPPGTALLSLMINNCTFDTTYQGIAVSTFFTGASAWVNATVVGNIFRNLAGAALTAVPGSSGTNTSAIRFLNNTIAGAQIGITTLTPYFDAAIENNIFVGTSNAVAGAGDPNASYNASYNCFYSNTVNFAGYPGIYGIPVVSNHNGDPCDAFFNIFQNPLFSDPSLLLLSKSSTCLDAGDPAIEDVCFSFSQRTAISDIGAYGGPDACNWPTQAFAPLILRGPNNEATCVGMTTQFSVEFGGAAPMSFQWYLNGGILSGQTNKTLVLPNVQTNQAGSYSVLLSNAFGTAMSPAVTLIVFDPCFDIHLYPGLSITGIVGRKYAVEYQTNVAQPAWVPLATNTLNTPSWLFIDTNIPLNAPSRFYRVVPKQ